MQLHWEGKMPWVGRSPVIGWEAWGRTILQGLTLIDGANHWPLVWLIIPVGTDDTWSESCR